MADFRFTNIIERKRNGEKLCDEEIEYFVSAVVKSMKKSTTSNEGVDRSQIGALLMAIYFKGLSVEETLFLTQTMKNSGHVFSWPEEWKHLVVDKHSTGGVGDKVSIVLAPALAALGLKVPMISGRSLGHTGGTLDKLESIPGFQVYMNKKEIQNIVTEVGCCIVGQTDDCVPADKVLYQCRDITATVDCNSLIVASIVSKKLSESLNTLVYDVKYGKGSSFKTKQEAIDCAELLVKASKSVNVSAVLTSMENPLGKTIGNSLEILEAIECLRGSGPQDVLDVTYTLGSEILRHVKHLTLDEGKSLIASVLQDGKALKKFHSMLIYQGVAEEVAQVICYGNADSILSKGPIRTDICYIGPEGYIQEIDPLVLARWWKEECSKNLVHSGVGIKLLKCVEDRIQTGDSWARVYSTSQLTEETLHKLQQSLSVHPSVCKRTFVFKIISC